jgi:hypothetical protein
MPEAVLRSGGIRADEFLLFVGVNSSESVVGVDVGWDGVSGMSQGLGLFYIEMYMLRRDIEFCSEYCSFL